MPSGSHGGSGGSHSSGGSSSGGGFYSGGSSSGSGSHGGVSKSSRPINIRFFGRHYYISAHNSSKVSVFASVIFFCLIFLVISVVLLIDSNSQIKKIKVDREYYLNMIENAENDNDYLKVGYLTDKFYNEDCEKWYFTYEIPTDDGKILSGYTFSVYTFEEISEFAIGMHMDFAVNSKVVTIYTDSINMGYKDIPLENDGEFISARDMKNYSILFISIMSALVVLFVVITILRIKKYAQKTAVTKGEPKNLNNGEIYCNYCGSKLNKNSNKCNNCGASVKK